MPTVADFIEDTRMLLFTGQREERNKLAVDLTPSQTALTCVYDLGSISRGSKLSIHLEDIYVWGTNNLTVSPIERAQYGTTAVLTYPAGTNIHVNPKFSNWEIYKALAAEIHSLASVPGLFAVSTVEYTYNPVVAAYTYTNSSIRDILEVRYSIPGPSREYPLSHDWELLRAMSDEFPQSTAIVVRDAYPGSTVLVKAKTPFTTLPASYTADVSTTGIFQSMYDIVPLGAAWRLTAPREVKRNFDEVQGDTRRAGEVPPGGNLGASRELGRLRNQRIDEEVRKLAQQFPVRIPRYPYQASYS